MDPVAVAVAIALIGLLGVVIGASLTEIFARRRESEAERRLLARERVAWTRGRDLERIDHTKQQLSALLTRSLTTAGGDKSGEQIQIGTHVYPRFDLSLVDEAPVMRGYLAILTELTTRPPASLVSKDDAARVATALNEVGRVLAEQERRVEAGEEMRRLDATLLAGDLPAAVLGLIGDQEPPPDR